MCHLHLAGSLKTTWSELSPSHALLPRQYHAAILQLSSFSPYTCFFGLRCFVLKLYIILDPSGRLDVTVTVLALAFIYSRLFLAPLIFLSQ